MPALTLIHHGSKVKKQKLKLTPKDHSAGLDYLHSMQAADVDIIHFLQMLLVLQQQGAIDLAKDIDFQSIKDNSLRLKVHHYLHEHFLLFLSHYEPRKHYAEELEQQDKVQEYLERRPHSDLFKSGVFTGLLAGGDQVADYIHPGLLRTPGTHSYLQQFEERGYDLVPITQTFIDVAKEKQPFQDALFALSHCCETMCIYAQLTQEEQDNYQAKVDRQISRYASMITDSITYVGFGAGLLGRDVNRLESLKQHLNLKEKSSIAQMSIILIDPIYAELVNAKDKGSSFDTRVRRFRYQQAINAFSQYIVSSFPDANIVIHIYISLDSAVEVIKARDPVLLFAEDIPDQSDAQQDVELLKEQLKGQCHHYSFFTATTRYERREQPFSNTLSYRAEYKRNKEHSHERVIKHQLDISLSH